MKSSGIGGQAVIEGVMMKNKDRYAVAVRKPDNEIEVVVKECGSPAEKHRFLGWPVIRGVVNFIDSLVVGMSTLSYSASFYEDDEPDDDAETKEKKKQKKRNKTGKNYALQSFLSSAYTQICRFPAVFMLFISACTGIDRQKKHSKPQVIPKDPHMRRFPCDPLRTRNL